MAPPRKQTEPVQPPADPVTDRIREKVRETVREIPTHDANGRIIALNRAGQPISRTSAQSGIDQFFIPPDVIPPGWSWQWKREYNVGQPDPGYMAELYQSGWEHVMTEQYPGIFMPLMDAQGNPNKGPVRRKGQALMERDMRLTLEAEREEKRRADERVGNAIRQRAGGRGLDTRGTHGVDTQDAAVRQNNYVRRSPDKDIPMPGDYSHVRQPID